MIAYQIVFDFSESGTIDKLTGLPQTLQLQTKLEIQASIKSKIMGLTSKC